MAKISETFRSQYLKAADLGGKRTTLTIESVAEEQVGPDKQDKIVIRFKTSDYGLILNKTNAQTLAEKLGDDTDGWAGAQVTLTSEKVSFSGQRVDAIRVADAVPDPF
jgi:hypothetical protein